MTAIYYWKTVHAIADNLQTNRPHPQGQMNQAPANLEASVRRRFPFVPVFRAVWRKFHFLVSLTGRVVKKKLHSQTSRINAFFPDGVKDHRNTRFVSVVNSSTQRATVSVSNDPVNPFWTIDQQQSRLVAVDTKTRLVHKISNKQTYTHTHTHTTYTNEEDEIGGINICAAYIAAVLVIRLSCFSFSMLVLFYMTR
ncbi:DNA cross-link repair 1A protein [Trichinella spiralis]|uniref:DNA cross-link repair 1A protein n=1 Tax=Trichinella spiralis TaxID=6334 RepID=A0ABR3KJ16_TRISP